MTFTRRSIWELETAEPGVIWDPYTVGYAHAVEGMRARSQVNPQDPTGWTYQAAMHGTYAGALPEWHWKQCQHGSWFFLPWHRMYLYWFEQIARSIVLANGGPEDWALPFWNYSLGGDSAALPPAFREPTWDPDGQGERPNPLYTDRRDPYYNAGNPMPATAVSLDALNDPGFFPPPGQGFGGPVTGFSHRPRAFGNLENVPHNQVHVQIGGDGVGQCQGGWMVDPNCAALDPIFWVHHSNIDRLWWVWQDAGHSDPDPQQYPAWATQAFTFFDTNGMPQVMHPVDVESIGALGYEYEAQPAPSIPGGRMAVPPSASASGDEAPAPTPPSGAPRVVAAAADGIDLSGGHAEVQVPLTRPAGASLRAAANVDDTSVQHVYLQVEDLSAEHTPGVSWEVHLTLPEDVPGGGGDVHVGMVSFFGVNNDPSDDDEHGLGPLLHRFEITHLLGSLGDRDEWDEIAATVRFVPVGPPRVQEGVSGSPRVGRVSITAH